MPIRRSRPTRSSASSAWRVTTLISRPERTSTDRRSNAPPKPPARHRRSSPTSSPTEFRNQWKRLNLDIDFFQRTTSPQHAKVVQDLFTRCLENGYIYKGSYTGQYCVYDELYVNEAKPGDPCPDCGRPTETVTEENYFFKLSAFQDKLLDLYEDNPEFILPETRRNEVLAFVRQGLSDLSISRTTIKWGIPLPVEGNHVFYVWFDALTTYKSAVEGEDLWPADLHLIGKEIVRFHAIFWPAFLMAAGLSAAETHLRARLAAVRERQDEQVARQHRAGHAHRRRHGYRRPSLFPASRNRASAKTARSATTRWSAGTIRTWRTVLAISSAGR